MNLEDNGLNHPQVHEEPEKDKSILDKFPRVLYYLLDWKDKNMETFINRYGGRKLKELSHLEIQDLFSQVSSRDILLMHKEVINNES